jgi:alkanesulfonate monooxygenase SsuD/methylene tetrahydromethanopterin reductase-like flavin-dependent oxidoreductase (luciferase family)
MPRQDKRKIGLLLPQWERGMDRETPRWTDIRDLAREAEAIGIDSLWAVDHFLIDRAANYRQRGEPVPEKLQGKPPLGAWECWSLLSAVAAVTERVEIGPLVACTGYRNPALQAKIAETVDEISGGRLILGLGAGDFHSEHIAFGYQWDKRISRFEEALQIIQGLLREEVVTFDGDTYTADNCTIRPRGPRPGGIPIMIGSSAARPRMARLTATYADIWNCWLAFGNSSPEETQPRIEAIDAACEKHGRDPASLQRSLTIGVGMLDRTIPGANPVVGEPAEIAETINQFYEQGFSHIQVYLAPMTPAGFEAFGKVIEELDR